MNRKHELLVIIVEALVLLAVVISVATFDVPTAQSGENAASYEEANGSH